MKADLCVDCSQPHSGKNGAVRCAGGATESRRRKSQNLCDAECFDPITRNARRCRHCSYPRHGVARDRVQVQDVQEVRPRLPEDVVDTLLSGRPWMRLEVERMAADLKPGQFVSSRVSLNTLAVAASHFAPVRCRPSGPSRQRATVTKCGHHLRTRDEIFEVNLALPCAAAAHVLALVVRFLLAFEWCHGSMV